MVYYNAVYIFTPIGYVSVHGWIMGKELVVFMLVTGTRWPSKKDRYDIGYFFGLWWFII